jgi:hypothetical protein
LSQLSDLAERVTVLELPSQLVGWVRLSTVTTELPLTVKVALLMVMVIADEIFG